jgi:hypothetical protein
VRKGAETAGLAKDLHFNYLGLVRPTRRSLPSFGSQTNDPNSRDRPIPAESLDLRRVVLTKTHAGPGRWCPTNPRMPRPLFNRRNIAMSPLRQRRQELCLTQERLATLSNVPQPVISMMERGRCFPVPTYVSRLCTALGLDLTTV